MKAYGSRLINTEETGFTQNFECQYPRGKALEKKDFFQQSDFL